MHREDMLRAQRDDIHAALMPNLPRSLLMASARALGMVHNGEPVYRDTNQMAICTDLALYGLPQGQQLLRSHLMQRADTDPELRDAMPGAIHMLGQIETTPQHGVVRLVPVMGGETVVLVDPQMSASRMNGEFVSTHVIVLSGHSITTGAPLLIHRDIVAKVRSRTDLHGASLAASLALTQWSYAPPKPTPARRAKPSRNAPCPCGSGRRYKACHGRRA